jgi:hypothetical protein
MSVVEVNKLRINVDYFIIFMVMRGQHQHM